MYLFKEDEFQRYFDAEDKETLEKPDFCTHWSFTKIVSCFSFYAECGSKESCPVYKRMLYEYIGYKL